MLRRRPIALAAALAGLALAAPASAWADCPGADAVPAAGNLAAVAQTTLCLLNEQRAAQGLRPLTEETRLTSASRAYAQEMVAGQFFDHVVPDGSTLVGRLTAIGYINDDVDWTAGENIAWGQGDLASPGSIVTAWMNSPGHRANILSGDYTQIGLGIATGSPVDPTWGATYTTDFGSTGDGSSTVDRSSTGTAPVRSASATAAVRQAAARRSAAKKAAARKRAARACTRARAAAKRTAKRGPRARARACSARVRAHSRARTRASSRR
jgi:uncharacterized protein YkwD